MEMINAIIVDDEPRARRVLINLLSKSSASINILAECNSVTDAVANIKTFNPQVVFLDIQMPNYAGYEIVNFFDDIDFEIIFVTAFDEYAIKAFDLCAIDYIVKPIDRRKLERALDKLNLRIEEKNKLSKYKTLLSTIESSSFSKIVIPELGNRRILNLKDILAIEADGAYSKVHLINSKCITVSKNLKYFERVLPENSNFFRSHRGWLINLEHIQSLNRTTCVIELKNNIRAKLSRSRFEEFNTAVL